MERTFKEKLELVNRYLYRTLIKMFTPKASQEFIYLLEDLTESEESFGRKINQAYSSLQETSHLIERLEGELTTKLERVNKLKDEYERYSVLAEVEEDKAKALMNQLERTLNKGKGNERWVAFLINLIAGLIVFVIGVAASPWVKGVLGI